MGPVRIVVAKPGLDVHDRGVRLVARALRDAGVEVVYIGPRQTPEQIVATALQEDVDAIGLSVFSGAHMTAFARVMDLLREHGAEDVQLFGGGVVPEGDIPLLEQMGVRKVFPAGTPMATVVAWVRENVGAGVTPSG